MSSQQLNTEQEHVDPAGVDASALDMRTLEDAIRILNGVADSMQYQLLENCDNIAEGVSSGKEEQQRLNILLESTIKKPLRKQMGRIKSVRRFLQEAQKKASQK